MAQSNSASLTRKTKKDDVEALLSDFDNLETKRTLNGASVEKATSKGLTGKKTIPSTSPTKDDAQLLLDDLDDLVKQRRAPTPKRTISTKTPSASVSRTPSTDNFQASKQSANEINKSTDPDEQSILPSDVSSDIALEKTETETRASSTHAPSASGSWGGWWSSATKFADQARAELEKRAAQVQSQVVETTSAAAAAAAAAASAPAPTEIDMDGKPIEKGRPQSGEINLPWQSAAQNINAFLKSHGGDLNKIRSDIGKVGIKRWNEILNVVVPPIESHEVLSITLSHDMQGFEGVPDVVFQILQRVMETHASSQHAEQQLIVNKAPERRTESAIKTNEAEDENIKPDMRPVIGFSEAWKLAESRLEELVNNHKANEKDEAKSNNDQSAMLPITTCPLFIRIQPVLDVLPGLSQSNTNFSLTETNTTHLYLCIILRDPSNNLTHRTVSQPLLKPYALLPFDQHPWAEELLSESLQNALGSVGLEYVRSRMQARSEALSKAAEAEQIDSQSADQ